MNLDEDLGQAYPSYVPKQPASSANEDENNFASCDDGRDPAAANHDNSSTYAERHDWLCVGRV